MQVERCPVCLSEHQHERIRLQRDGEICHVQCDACGYFDATASVVAGELGRENKKLTSLRRAALSHLIRRSAQENEKPPRVTSDTIEHFMKNPTLPTPGQQVINAIRFIGDRVRNNGRAVNSLQPSLYAIIGAPSPKMAGDLVKQLHKRGWLSGSEQVLPQGYSDFLNVDLTLEGWEHYDKERAGKLSGRVGFLAMAFKRDPLETFAADILKPAVKEIGYDLVDMRDVSRAGIIDNLMREQIRDAAFVVVDLTHDNSGAYWEAGYAEGLGKPVIYICERSKFEKAKTHFDTNHCTTVLWETTQPNAFKKELVATLRRSLNLFA